MERAEYNRHCGSSEQWPVTSRRRIDTSQAPHAETSSDVLPGSRGAASLLRLHWTSEPRIAPSASRVTRCEYGRLLTTDRAGARAY